MKKIFWLSQHAFSPAQVNAVKALHGDDCEVVHEKVTFLSPEDCVEKVTARAAAGFVYFVGGGPHYLFCASAGLSFGVFENHPAKRTDGSFGLKAVYHVESGRISRVWENPDPNSDVGDVLMKPKG